MNAEGTQEDYQQQDCDYVTALLNTIADKVDGLRLGGVNFSFVTNESGELRMSVAQCWFSEKQSGK